MQGLVPFRVDKWQEISALCHDSLLISSELLSQPPGCSRLVCSFLEGTESMRCTSLFSFNARLSLPSSSTSLLFLSCLPPLTHLVAVQHICLWPGTVEMGRKLSFVFCEMQ